MGGEATRILRASIHAFLSGYPSFVSVAGLLALPASAALLVSQALITTAAASSSSSSSSALIHHMSARLHSLFSADAFPSSSPIFPLLTLMLSQTLFSSLLTLPFTLTFLLLAKASVVQTLGGHAARYLPLLLTHSVGSLLFLTANSAIFALLFLLFSAADLAGLSSNATLLALASAAGALLYSVVVANTVVACNLAVYVSAAEDCSGFDAVLRACALVRGRVATALSVALPTNLAMAAVEVLFQYRVVRAYRLSSSAVSVSITGEAFTIAYMHAAVAVVDMIASWFFYKSCRLKKEKMGEDWLGYHHAEIEPEEKVQV